LSRQCRRRQPRRQTHPVSRVSWLRRFPLSAAELVCVVATAVILAEARPAAAVPIFAERYGFSCSVCHTAVPDLNAFGNAFRRNGFVLPGVPQKKVVPVALRFQESYVKELPQSQTRHFNALAVLISTANFGHAHSYSYFTRYFFGSQGAPGSLYYAWLQHVNIASGVFERAGLFNLPLLASATQRLDTITPPPVYTYTVGHASANFATPRWGLMLGQRTDRMETELAFSDDEYHGAAYGAPVPPSILQQSFAYPETFLSVTSAVGGLFHVGGLVLSGARRFQAVDGNQTFTDAYVRDGVQGSLSAGSFDLMAQQIWGHDSNADGRGTVQGSSGGFVLLKYHTTAHSYLGLRYDAAANPYALRDWDLYGVVAPTAFSRFVVETTRPINQPGAKAQLNLQLLLGVPVPGRLP
jgi:hypothetical protein